MKNKPKEKRHQLKNFSCGLASGLIQAVVFNPWDRALYLSVKESRPFRSIQNFQHPFSGLLQTIFQRAISAGLYFPLEQYFIEFFSLKFSHQSNISHWVALASGNCAGAVNGLVLNPLAAIKYHTWGIEECERENFFRTAMKLYKHGGFRPFYAGTLATVSRDMTFGGCFAVMRHGLLEKDSTMNKFFVNGISGFVATLLSSPLNYVRNMHYATPPSVKHKPALVILANLWASMLLEKSFWARAVYLQQQLRVGWGTARVACGMALGAQLYDKFTSLAEEL